MFKTSFKFYTQYFKLLTKDKLFFCRVQLLFMYFIVPNIDTQSIKNAPPTYHISLKSYILNVFLAFYSIYNLLKIKFKGVKIAHYLIDIKNSNSLYDIRSQEILDILSPQYTANFMHINNYKYTLLTLRQKSNAIYFEAIYYVLKPFLRKKKFTYTKPDNTFAIELLEIHQETYSDSYYIHQIVRMLLKFLKIKTFITIDDTRYSNEIYIAAKELDIVTVGYMHGRFNEYHLALFEFPFDKYFIWSDYFKEKLLSLSPNYQPKNIEVVGHFKIKSSLKLVQDRSKNILWLGESNIDYQEIFPFIHILSMNGYNLFFRGKPGEKNNLSSFLNEHKIQIDTFNTFFESLQNNQIGLVIGTHSTALMESWLVRVPAIAILSSYDYGSHLWRDGLIELCLTIDEMPSLVEKYFSMPSYEIEKIRKTIWGENYTFNASKTKSILLGYQ